MPRSSGRWGAVPPKIICYLVIRFHCHMWSFATITQQRHHRGGTILKSKVFSVFLQFLMKQQFFFCLIQSVTNLSISDFVASFFSIPIVSHVLAFPGSLIGVFPTILVYWQVSNMTDRINVNAFGNNKLLYRHCADCRRCTGKFCGICLAVTCYP